MQTNAKLERSCLAVFRFRGILSPKEFELKGPLLSAILSAAPDEVLPAFALLIVVKESINTGRRGGRGVHFLSVAAQAK